MRELKYRLWDDEFKEYSSYHLNRALVQDINKHDRFLFEQYTGLKDKNGKEIYEGDILAFERYKNFQAEQIMPFEVAWDDKNAGWVNFSPKNIVVIIGNIHENPELL